MDVDDPDLVLNLTPELEAFIVDHRTALIVATGEAKADELLAAMSPATMRVVEILRTFPPEHLTKHVVLGAALDHGARPLVLATLLGVHGPNEHDDAEMKAAEEIGWQLGRVGWAMLSNGPVRYDEPD